MPKTKLKKTLDLWSIRHLALRLSISADELISVSKITDKFYLPWQKPKGDGSFRDLTTVFPRLKTIQKAIHQLLKKIRLDDSAQGGVPGKTNRSNAAIHCGQTFIYKLDFKSYFPSIPHHRVFYLFRHELKCSEEVASVLSKLCTVNGCVPQGAHTSMDIANLVCRDLDPWLRNLAISFGLKYTRYVDDLTFSGKKIPARFVNKFKRIIRSKRWLSLNDKKEALKGRNQAQTVTGLNVKYEKPRITKSYKNSVKTEKHILSKYASNRLTNDELNKSWSSIKGKENYISHIEGA